MPDINRRWAELVEEHADPAPTPKGFLLDEEDDR